MEEKRRVLTRNSLETLKIGEELARQKNGAHIICLYGELGSGKTTFAQGFAKGLGLSTRLLSPTFIIVRRYSLPNKSSFLYHIDLYRVKETENLGDLGLREIFSDPGSYVLIEWAEKLGGLLPQKRVDVRFTTLSDDSHEIAIYGK